MLQPEVQKPQQGLSCAGITLSPAQVKRGTELAKERGLDNVQFQVLKKIRPCGRCIVSLKGAYK